MAVSSSPPHLLPTRRLLNRPPPPPFSRTWTIFSAAYFLLILSHWAVNRGLETFAVLTLFILAVGYIAQATFRRSCARTAQDAHDRMLGGVMASPLRFFETTPSGRMMNRFSADIQQLDVELASRGFRFAQGGPRWRG